ncbi:hypothetical protein BASA81_008867 [Batrachochytrium salamandrivorans]|nr:hypothetical protein BASA81_008867 [Batrachochytrium salamandrivorans]
MRRKVLAGLWCLPVLAFVNDTFFTLALVRDDGMLPLTKRGDFVLVDRRNKNLGGGERRVNHVVLIRNPEADRGESQLRLIRRIAQHPFHRGGELVMKKDNQECTEARDSKQFGPIPEALVLGHVLAVVFPPWRVSKV